MPSGAPSRQESGQEKARPNDRGAGPDLNSTERVTDPAQSAEVGQHLHAGQGAGPHAGVWRGPYVGGRQSSRAARRAANREGAGPVQSLGQFAGGDRWAGLGGEPGAGIGHYSGCRCSSPTR